MKVAALQLPTLGLGNNRLIYYLQTCVKNDVKIVCLSEYAINSFFKEIEKMPKGMIIEQSQNKLELMKDFTKENDITIIAPIILHTKNGFVKTCVKVQNGVVKKYEQQILIDYSHWNEKSFFKNKQTNSDNFKLFTFNQNGFKIALMFGYELHFDFAFKEIMSKKVDLLIVPTASTFESNPRWLRLIQTRAFLNSVQILRINRIGLFDESKISWDFYGNSCFVDEFGNVINELGAKEELLFADIKKTNKARNIVGFEKVVNAK